MNVKEKTQKLGFDSVELFTAHCDKQARKRKASFSKEEVTLMVRLAGSPKDWPKPQEIEKGAIQSYDVLKEIRHLVERHEFIREQSQKAKSFADLKEIALMIVGVTHKPLGFVAGPITSGGKGSIELNILAMQEYMEQLYQTGETIFDQTPFEEAIERLRDKTVEYDYRILNEFYLPIFKSGYIKKMFFMRDWKSSKGARWEHRQCVLLGIEIIYQQ